MYTITWNQRDDEECDSDDQVTQDVEFEELEPMLLMHEKIDTQALDPDSTTGRAAFVSMEPTPTVLPDDKVERQSSNRKCPGGSYHISRIEYMDEDTAATDRSHIDPGGGFVRDNAGALAEEKIDELSPPLSPLSPPLLIYNCG